jgi:hypothetical protein
MENFHHLPVEYTSVEYCCQKQVVLNPHGHCVGNHKTYTHYRVERI